MTATTGDAELESLRFPRGRFERQTRTSPEQRQGWISDIEALPGRIRAAVAGLGGAALDTPYREGGWTVRQVVHHVPDSHVNGYIRFTLALVETGREAALYEQTAWAEVPFARNGPIEPSLILLDGLHARWTATIGDLRPEQWSRTLRHPKWGMMTIDDIVNLYAWHSRHHVGHIEELRKRKGW